MNNSLLARFFRYLRRPTYYINSPKKRFLEIIVELLRLFALLYLLALASGLLIYLVTSIFSYDFDQNSVVSLVQNAPIVVTFILAVIIAPITEELTFRLFLRYSPWKMALSLTFILIFSIDFLKNYIFTNIPEWFLSIQYLLNGMGILSYLIFAVATTLVIYVIIRTFVKTEKAIEIYKKHFGKLFYLSVILFALIHITNYLNLGTLILLTPFFILPQFFAGLFLGYVRMIYGFKWGILFHAAYNLLTLLPFIIFSLGSENLKNLIFGSETTIVNLPTADLILLSFVGFGAIFVIVLFIALNIWMVAEYFLKKEFRFS